MREFVKNARSIPVVPILVIIPYWEGDKPQCAELLRVLAGLQKEHARQECHIMLVNRKDCKADPNFVKIISPKFNVLTYSSESNLKGWPSGPNGMFGATMINAVLRLKGRYECLYWLETDAIPITPEWYKLLAKEWKNRHPKANIVGCRSDCNGDGTGDHITGCALYHPNIARLLPQITTCDNVAWDYLWRNKIVQMGQHTNLIENWYKATNLPLDIADRSNVGVAIIHGCKDLSVVNSVKQKYGIS